MVILILVILGLCLGSFVNAFVWRLHGKKDWIRGRSVCVHCKHQLAPGDLIPVFSWLTLGGKCRYCKKPISYQYPLVELLTALVFVGSYIYWPQSFDAVGIIHFCFWLVFVTGFLSLAIYDLKWMLLPNKIVFPLIWLALSQTVFLVLSSSSSMNALVNTLLSVFFGFGLFWVLFQVSSGKWIGGGDVKLGGLLGLVLASPTLMLLTIFTASVAGTAYSLPLLITGKVKKSSRVPFGPFLILGAIIAQIFGESIINWYRNKLAL